MAIYNVTSEARIFVEPLVLIVCPTRWGATKPPRTTASSRQWGGVNGYQSYDNPTLIKTVRMGGYFFAAIVETDG
ncbi:hypothetical protein [Rhizobium ruizarguesonis]|uniref:hypothetical protein n=1 Tax=Rhizobium ruizarguesonis TaxID=2081791 RepID=UPI001FED6CFA|nr:hypothetical protein [Rhizobium ruizarguesonis]